MDGSAGLQGTAEKNDFAGEHGAEIRRRPRFQNGPKRRRDRSRTYPAQGHVRHEAACFDRQAKGHEGRSQSWDEAGEGSVVLDSCPHHLRRTGGWKRPEAAEVQVPGHEIGAYGLHGSTQGLESIDPHGAEELEGQVEAFRAHPANLGGNPTQPFLAGNEGSPHGRIRLESEEAAPAWRGRRTGKSFRHRRSTRAVGSSPSK